ncbi:MAG: DUF4340 domain-containing protein [Planctomycetes bacterium]|nr:DUF4340 domain-containing protein [Planctomycetota bacterium]
MKTQLTAALVGSVLLAIGTTLWTWWPHKTEAAKEAEKTGQLLTLEGKRIEPEDITSLRVASWDAESKDSKVFEVARKDNVWVIPTKYDYPADGGSRVGRTAGGVLNIPRGPLVTNDPKFFADLGVVDPLKEGTADPEGRGKRVTLKDASGAVVVDLIVGKKAEKADVSYVREGASNDVYTAKVDVDISTSFKDWVETDLLKIVSGDLRMIGIRDYSIDMDTHEFKERASTIFTRPKDKNEWSCDKTPKEKVVNQETLGKLLSEATALRLADVHPFVDDMLDDCGILRSREGAVFGKEGMMVLGSKDGLRLLLGIQQVDQLERQVVLRTQGPHRLAVPLKGGRLRAGVSRRQHRVLADDGDVYAQVMAAELQHPWLRLRRLAEQGEVKVVGSKSHFVVLAHELVIGIHDVGDLLKALLAQHGGHGVQGGGALRLGEFAEPQAVARHHRHRQVGPVGFFAAVVLQKCLAALLGIERLQERVGLSHRVGRRLVVTRRRGARLGRRAGLQCRPHRCARGVHREADRQSGCNGGQHSNAALSPRALVRH